MSDTRISELPAVASFLLAQEFAVNDAGISRKASGTQIASAWGLDVLGSTVLTAGAHETPVLTFTYPPGSGIPATRDFLWGFIRIASYGGTPDASGDIGSLRVNEDSGANYWSRHLSYALGVWTDTPLPSTTLIRLAPSQSRLSRNVFVTVNNLLNRSKTFNIKNQTGTNDASAVGEVNIAGGEWVNTVEQINRAQLINAGSNNLGTGSGMIWLGKNF